MPYSPMHKAYTGITSVEKVKAGKSIRILLQYRTRQSGPGSSVGMGTAYGLDGPGIESRWGEIFRTSSDRP